MLTLESVVTVRGIAAHELFDLMLECDDRRYRAWWPGTHHQFHVVRPSPRGDHLGDVVWMDELVGDRHLRMSASVCDVVPGERIAWQLRPWGLRPPVRLTLTVRETNDGLRIRHTLTAGWTGWARVADPLWRLYFNRSFAAAMDQHARSEFTRLPGLLHRDVGGRSQP